MQRFRASQDMRSKRHLSLYHPRFTQLNLDVEPIFTKARDKFQTYAIDNTRSIKPELMLTRCSSHKQPYVVSYFKAIRQEYPKKLRVKHQFIRKKWTFQKHGTLLWWSGAATFFLGFGAQGVASSSKLGEGCGRHIRERERE